MRTIFAVPPILSSKGQAQSTQNRQYQFFKDPTYIFPVIPATFISMILTAPPHEVLMVDAIAEGLNEVEFAQIIRDMKPDYIVFEANTMVFNRYCEVIDAIKTILPHIKIILCGEHATALPQEAKEKSKADFILHGGKWYFDAFKVITGNDWPKDRVLPHINRDASRWWLYAYNNGNFRNIPATYTMASQDCWYRPKQACTFCSWVSYHPNTTTRSVEDFLDEIEHLIQFGFREFFDDSGTFPVGEWLKTFCTEMIERGYNKHIVFGINMRFGVLSAEQFELLAKAGCRFILWGFESVNQSTLDHLHKGYKTEDMRRDLANARKNNIWNHLTVMMGYPWETLKEERNTYKVVRELLLNDQAASMQATIYMPYPGTRSFQEAKEQGILLTENWDEWTMGKEVVKLKYDFKEALKLQREYYNISLHPKFIFNKIKNLRTVEDVKFYWRTSKKVFNRFSTIFNNQGVSIDG